MTYRPWSRLVIGGVAAVVAAFLQIAPVHAAGGSASSEQIAYACFRNRGSHICVANGDGSGERVLGNASQQFNVGPVWSPDGTRIAYLCGWDRQSANAFIPTRDIVDFGPVGFTRNSGGEVCVVDVASGDSQQVSQTNGTANAPAWSPNGKMITYSASTGPGTVDNGPGIWAAYIDGVRGWHHLTEGSGDDMPAWSPDGTQMAYSTPKGLYLFHYSSYVSRPFKRAGKDEVLLGPTWSPDGTMLAYTRYTRNARETWVIRADGSKARRLERTERLEPNVGVAFTPSWTPDGKGVVALRTKNQQGQLVFLPLSPTAKARPITELQAVQGAWGALWPAVSSNGTVAFTDDRDRGRESISRLAVVSVDGTGERKVEFVGVVDDPEWPLSEIDPRWQPRATPTR